MPLIYAPDRSPDSPGVIVAASGIRPSVNGFMQWPIRFAHGWAALAATPTSAYLHITGTNSRIIAGTTTKLYELSLTGGGTYTVTDVSLGGGSYTAPSYTGSSSVPDADPGPWCFTSFGAYVLASCKFTSNIQVQASKGAAFTAIADSPECSTMCTFKNFIICGNFGTYGAVTGVNDGVAWSALGDHTSWVPDAATQAGYQQLVDVPGRIVCVKPLGDAVVVYKENAIWLMRYVGPPTIFAFQLVDNKTGALAAADSYTPVVDIGGAHIFIAKDAICSFDGNRVTRISDGVISKRFTTTLGITTSFNSGPITHDPVRGDLIFWTTTDTNGIADGGFASIMYGCPCYNYKMGKWGAAPDISPASVKCAIELSQTVMSAGASGYINFISHPLFYNDKILYTFDGGVGTQSWQPMKVWVQVGRYGQATTLRRVLPRFVQGYGSVTPTLEYLSEKYFYKYQDGAYISIASGTWNISRQCFDLLTSDNWHTLGIKVPANTVLSFELMDILYDPVPAGRSTESALVPAPL